jgi:hypothetical protein
MAPNNRPEWLNSIGLVAPRFTVRIVDVYPDGTPIEEEDEDEDEADVHLKSWVGCIVRRRWRDALLCEPEWIDEVPPHARGEWLQVAAHALRHMDDCHQFLRWKSLRPVMEIAGRIGLNIGDCQNWSDYAEAFRAEKDLSNGDLIQRARREFFLLSTGEVPVLMSMLHAADYSHVADELAGNNYWRRLDRTCGDHAEAIALAITRQ